MKRNFQNETSSPKPKRKKSKWRLIIFWILVLIVSSCLMSIFILKSANDIFGFGKEDKLIEITVTEGMNVKDVAEALKEKNIIEQSSTFMLYSKIRNREGIIQAGDYILNSNMSYDQIIIAMRSGNIVKEEIRLIFYEGMTVLDIANLLAEKKVCDRDEFLDAVNSETFGSEFEDMLPKNEMRFRRLEGYLFPDTYDFYVNENVYSVIKKFVKNFQIKIFPDIYEEIKDSGMTLDEAVTLASVIQKEASNKKEMYRVSSVFHNRMENASADLPMLQSDVTINYVEDDIKPFQTKKTQDLYDAYNTFVCEGLPVGPICSPGIDAIKATIKPEKTDYYYFVTDVNGKYYYSITFDQHMANVRKASKIKKAE